MQREPIEHEPILRRPDERPTSSHRDIESSRPR